MGKEEPIYMDIAVKQVNQFTGVHREACRKNI